MRTALLLALCALAALTPAAAQPEAPSRLEPLALASGLHDGPALADSTAEAAPRLAFQHTVRVPDARWLRLHFARYRLGEGSYVLLTALEDGAAQRLTAEALEAWRLRSAYFNGDAVAVALYVAPGDEGAFFELDAAEAGLPDPQPETICGSGDDRTASSDAAIGRLLTPTNGRCTGWISSTGALLAAGHCTATVTLQFNVPASDPDGSLNHPAPEHQYAVGRFVFEAVPNPDNPGNTLRGQDWMVFTVAPNTETGLMPAQAQAAFYRLSQDHNPTAFRVTGYGTDDGAANGTQQTDTGSNEGEVIQNANWVYWNHRVDTMGGNSGSPLSLTGEPLSVGIHTHGGCDGDSGSNGGTSFESDDLAAAIDDFFGTNVVHLDAGHPVSVLLQAGTPLRPYKTVARAVSGVPAGGVIRAVEGTYAAGANVYTKASVWMAPVGSVVVR